MTDELHHEDLVKRNQDHFDEQSAKWDDDPEHAAMARESYASLVRHVGKHLDRAHTRVLNFGCGNGLLEEQLRHDVKHVVGVDISGGMVERVCRKVEAAGWGNVEARQLDIMDDGEASRQMQDEGFDLVVSCYTFHHLQDVTAIGKRLAKCLNPGGYFCIIDFAAKDKEERKGAHSHGSHSHGSHSHGSHSHGSHSHGSHSHLSEAAKATIGTHDGFSRDFLVDFYQNQLGLTNVQVHPASPLKCGDDEYPTVIAYGQKR